MSKWFNIPHTEGVSSRQAHANLPKNTYERELGKEGFNGPSSHMYHPHPPTSWTSIQGPLSHHAFDTRLSTQSKTEMPYNVKSLLNNHYIDIRIWHCSKSMDHLVRNADGDELLFIHEGQGNLYCDYGHLPISEGDYVIIPKGTLWRIDITTAITVLLIEATQQSYKLPDKGMLGQHAIFDSAVLDIPEINDAFMQQQHENDSLIYIKRLNEITEMRYPYNPLDAIGWHGTLMPIKINWRDLRPVMSHRYHLPPSVHTTFITPFFMISTFVPRPIESDPNVLKVPFYHSNDDYDEVIFYHSGQFFSRDNIDAGMMTLHPSGIPHGPHPKAFEIGKNHSRQETNEVAVMVDSRYPLTVTDAATQIEDIEYVNSWK